MNIDTIVKALNDSIEDRRRRESIKTRAFLLPTTSITPDAKFPAYKQFNYILWIINKSHQNRIVQVKQTIKITNDAEKIDATRSVEKEFITKIFDLLSSNKYEYVINGSYRE